jgi:competence protein ComEC
MKILSKIWNGANIFALILISFVLFSSTFTFKNSLQNKDVPSEKSFRITAVEKDSFNQTRYYALSNKALFTIDTSELQLELGKEYIGSVKTNYFDNKNLKSFENYLRSLGVIGKLTIVKNEAIFINQNCDWFCKLLKTNKKLQSGISKKYQQFSCQNFVKINQFLAPNTKCSEISGLSMGLVSGDTSGFTQNTTKNFQKLGLSHLVAVSGFQVVLLATFIEKLLIGTKISKNARTVIILFFILGLIIFVGPEPPVIRSSLTLLIIYLATTLGRGVNYLRALFYSAVIMLISNPFYVFSISFQLSFLASIGLGIKVFEQASLIFSKNLLFKTFTSNILIFFLTLPIISNLSGYTSPISIITNLILIPTIPIISILNILGTLPIIGEIFLIIPNIFQALLLFFTNDFGPNTPLVYLQKFNMGEIVLYYLVLFTIVNISRFLTTRNLFSSKISNQGIR